MTVTTGPYLMKKVDSRATTDIPAQLPQMDPAESASACLTLADQIALTIMEAADERFGITLHYLVGAISCSVNPEALSMRLGSEHGTVFFVADSRGDTWLVGSPTGGSSPPAQRILASGDEESIAHYCLELLTGGQQQVIASAGTH